MKKIIRAILLLFVLQGMAWGDVSGSVAQVDAKISLIDGTSFIDLGSTINLAQYATGSIIKICSVTYSTQCATGYIKAAGSSETLGTELLPNTAFDDVTNVSGANATVSSVAGGQSGNCLQVTATSFNGFGYETPTATATGRLIKASTYAKLGTGAAIKLYIEDQIGNALYNSGFIYPATWTQYERYVIATGNSTRWDWIVSDGAGTTGLFDTATIKQVTAPGSSGVTITSTYNGSTYSWATKNFSNFDAYNDSAGYTYEIRTNPSTFYVSNSGSDSASGLSGFPWQTISKVNSSYFMPGDTISFNRGDTWREALTVPESGTSGASITFTNYGSGNLPIISGANVVTGWTQESSLYLKNGYASIPNTVIIDGVLQRNPLTKPEMAAGYWWYDSGNQRVYIYGDPASKTVEVGTRNYSIDTNGKSYLVFDGLNLNGAMVAGLFVANSSSNVTLRNCTLKNSYLGVNTGASSGNNLEVSSNNFSYFYYGAVGTNNSGATGYLIKNNQISYTGIYGMQVVGCNASTCTSYPIGIYFVSGGTVEENVVSEVNQDYNTVASATIYGAMQATILGDASGQIYRKNRVYNSGCYALELWASTNSKVHYNLLYNNQSGIGVATNVTGAEINNNVIWNNGTAGTSGIGGAGITLYWNTTGYSTVSSIKNNIIGNNHISAGSDYSYQINIVAGNTLTASDYNVFYPTGVNLFNGSGTPRNFAYWQGTLTYDTHGNNTDPLLDGNYSLQNNSPAKDAGVVIPGLHSGNSITGGDAAGNTWLYGAGIDTGAYEVPQFIYGLPSWPIWRRQTPKFYTIP